MNVSCPTWNFPELNPLAAIQRQVVISGSASGAPAHFKDMFDFADTHNIKPWIQMYKMKDINKAIEDFEAGKARFRIVLEN
jgi:D-arabinose 1-dehydrogenase-like Zn-dependent alcohol dehydrogenase